MTVRRYYEAYDDRYRQVHKTDVQWASDVPSAIVGQIMQRYGIGKKDDILEVGCGEGRDAVCLLNLGYCVTATDVSPEAIRYCREKQPGFSEHFQILDCVAGKWEKKYDFIFAIAVVHMLVEDADRAAFYCFLLEHLNQDGVALVCTMGDGEVERASDISEAFNLQQRLHGQSGKKLMLAGTSCRMVSWKFFLNEIEKSGLTLLEHGITPVEPDFPVMMYAVVKK